MAIKRIKVSNFKSFKDLDIELGMFNVVIGANAAGKSNLTHIFRFLREVEKNDLKDAISIHGGPDSLYNIRLGTSVNVTMEIVSDTKFGWGTGSRGLRIYEVTYEFSLRFQGPKNGYRIATDRLTQRFQFVRLERQQKELFEEAEELGKGSITIANLDGKLAYSFDPPEIEEKLREEDIAPMISFFPRMFGQEIPYSDLLIQTQYRLIPPWESLFEEVAIYDIDPHIAKNPVQITGKSELEEDGANLALVLNEIVDDGEKKRKLCNLMGDLLPFVEDISTEKFAKSLSIRMRENYYADKYLRAYLLSDGTINIAALIAALHFQEKTLVIVEEPERNIHPHLISKLMDMMKEASKKKQVIVTTHSPEVVKHAGLENILLVSRDKGGFSTISRPGEKEEVKIFLANELGLDELYVQNLLAV